jgi:hypothetical protein
MLIMVNPSLNSPKNKAAHRNKPLLFILYIWRDGKTKIVVSKKQKGFFSRLVSNKEYDDPKSSGGRIWHLTIASSKQQEESREQTYFACDLSSSSAMVWIRFGGWPFCSPD